MPTKKNSSALSPEYEAHENSPGRWYVMYTPAPGENRTAVVNRETSLPYIFTTRAEADALIKKLSTH